MSKPFILFSSHLHCVMYSFIRTTLLFSPCITDLLIFEFIYFCMNIGVCTNKILFFCRSPFSSRCGHSPVYRTREMSGRALVPFIMINQVPQTVSSLLAGLPDCTDPFVPQNAVHGTLLQVSLLFA